MSESIKQFVQQFTNRKNPIILTNGKSSYIFDGELKETDINNKSLYNVRVFHDNIPEYVKEFDELRKIYKINDNCQYRMTNLQLMLYYSILSKKEQNNSIKPNCDEIDAHEDQIIKLSSPFSILYGNKQRDKSKTSYDVNSFYPYCLSSYKFLFNKGKMINLKDIGDLPKYTYYYIKIKIDLPTLPFYYKPTNNILWVTNFDVYVFDLHGTKYELVDGDNCYIYEPIRGKVENVAKIYDTFIKKLYKTKNNSQTHKLCFKSLHGVIFSNKSYKEQKPVLDDKGNIMKTIDIDTMEEIDLLEDEKHTVHEFKNIIGHRNYIFFYSYTRYILYKKYIQPLLKANIKIDRIWCDSIQCEKNPILDAMVGPDMGQMKYE
jgi:hypothetical protein